MSVPKIKFADKKDPEFYKELRKRVNKYFSENKISRHANFNMKFKSFFMVTLYLTPLALMLTGVVSSVWGTTLMWVLMGFGMSGIGLSIMHDANHGSYSTNQNVNKFMGWMLVLIGGYPANWRVQHNVLHHTFTNIEGYDEDIEKKGIMRFTPNQPQKKIFKFQILYAPLLYAVLTIYWFLSKDYEQLARYNKLGLLEGQKLTFKRALAEVILVKVVYTIVFLVLPLLFINLPWGVIILGFLLMHAISGLILAFIFQSAHVIEETEFFIPDKNQSVEENWAILQMRTTANFANGSIFFSWFIGGLNYQIEHHLFPNICHVHYRQISKIVKATAKEYDVPYHHHTTFLGALKSHFTLLHELGTGKYDERMKAKTA